MLKVGVIGVGSISASHIEAYRRHPEVELIALCDTNEQRLKEKGEKYDVQKLFTQYEELLAEESVDAVSICTWNNTHAEIAIAALQANKHVLVEKPLSMTWEEAKEVEVAADQSGKILQVGFVRRHASNAHVLNQFISEGELGEIYYAKATCLRRLGNPGGWFSDKSRSGGGPLIDLGVHMIDLCWYLMGKPKPISVTGNTYNKLGNRSHVKHLSFYKAADYDATRNSVEDLTNALIRFENGASLFVDVSFTLHAKENEINVKLYGDKGGAEIEPALVIMGEKNQTILNMTPQIDHPSFHFGEAFANEIAHFVACCQTNRESIAPVSDGVEIMRMLEAIYQSAREGKEIYLGEGLK
ncbi:Gfo/Idh/MocA family protein [Oceanobacillus kapialis]|uniref:Gfo/Idh/MocA family protein n=1 Tax=Oceanobacillus kapialis TaxID=481353 RepID=A0ABW5PWK9_9BACI